MDYSKFPMSLFVNLLQHGAGLSLRPVAVATAVLAFSGLSAQAARMDEVVVSATRTEQRLSDVLADVTVVDSEAIERSGFDSVAQLLSRQPGIQITSNGGPAAESKVFVRGANTQYTAVYLDGVRLDSQVTSGGVTWANIPLALIDRIEILRGPAAAVYGSDAVAGVILLTTKKGEDAWHPYVGAGYGTHGTYKADAGINGGSGQWDYSLAMVREGSKGFDAQPAEKLSNEEGFSRSGVNASLGLNIDPAHALRLTMTQSKTQSDYVAKRVGNDNQYHRDMTVLGASWQATWTAFYKSTLSVSSSQDKYVLQPSGNRTDARLHNYLWQNEFVLPLGQKITAIVERREDSLVNPSVQKSSKQTRHQNAFALGYGITLNQHALQLNARRDIDSEFGGQNTASAAYAWNFAYNWSAGASIGTSFRAPTLYQRFSSSGDASLRPEHGRNKEVSLRWRSGDNHFSATVYRNKLQNMISSVEEPVNSGSYFYRNVSQAVLEGVTLAGGYRVGAFKWHGSVDFQNPHDQDKHLLERRSKRFATIGVETTMAGTDFGAELYAASRRYNKISDTKMSLDGYALVHLTASKQIAKNFTLSARVDNLFDRDYELAQGYATAGRTLYVGLKWMPQ